MMNTLVTATITTFNLQEWIKANVIPLLVLIAAISLFALARKGDNAKAMKVVGGMLIALAVLGLSVSGNAESVGSGMWTLVTGT